MRPFKINLWMKTAGLACLILCCFGLSAVASAGSMTAEVDKTGSSMDEPFWLTVGVQGSLDGDVVVPETKDFEIIRTGESTNISIINGAMTKERQYTYQVRALKEGRLTIPGLKAKIDDKDVTTEPIIVEVKGGTPSAPDGGSASAGQKMVLVERELPKTTLYEGESVISKVRLLTRARLTGATPARDAAPDWRLISVEGQKNTEVTRDGARWNAIELTEGMIPLKSGKLKAPPFGINASWIAPIARRRTPRSVFDMFQQGMFNTGEEVSKKLLSESFDVTVKPLPSPRPADFGDIVGAFSLSAQVSKRDLGIGETATVTIEIKGQGALDRARDVKLAVAGAKVYDDKPSLTEKVEPGAGLVSKRVIKFAVVPNAAGTIDLGKIKLSSFNPFTENYEALSADLGQLRVAGSTAAAGVATPQQPVSSTELSTAQSPVAQDLKTNHNQEVNTPTEMAPRDVVSEMPVPRPWYRTTLALALEILALVVLIVFVVTSRVWRKTRQKMIKFTDPKLAKIDAAITSLERDGAGSFGQGMEALKTVLAKAGQDPNAMTSVDMVRASETSGYDVSFVSRLQGVLAEVDLIAYGGGDRHDAGANTIKSLLELLRICRDRGH